MGPLICVYCNRRLNDGEDCGCRCNDIPAWDSYKGPWYCLRCNKRLPDGASKCGCDAAPPAASILTEAASLISGDRRDAYGDYANEAEYVAAGWEVLRRGHPIDAKMVPLMMTWLKMVRESHGHKRDNLVDAAGYLALLDQLYEK